MLSSPAFGQADPNGPDPSKMRIRFGPVSFNPSITLGNVGIDRNVFNLLGDRQDGQSVSAP